MNKKSKTLILVAGACVVLGGAAWFGFKPSAKVAAKAPKQQSYQLTTIARGTIESVVSASGTLSPVSEVSVLPQMSGRALKVHADYNDHVKKGQLLVELDTTMLKLSEKEYTASVAKAKANYDLQATTVSNNEKLAAKGLISEYDLASSKSTLAVDAAELASAEASLESIRMQIEKYAYVTSPIDGIVLERNVDEGSTVVEGSSSNSSSLFTIAGDLSKMEIEASVDELDISSIHSGQEARFTVEALPGKTFSGSVREVRLVPTTSSNVVSYTVIVDAPNKDGKLLPGMTAEIDFIKEKKENVLIVPNAALRFTPAGLTQQEIAKMQFIAGLGDLSAEQKKEAEARYDEIQKQAATNGAQAKTGTTGLTGALMGGGMGGPGMGGPGGRSWNGQNQQNGQKSAANAQAGQQTVVRKPLWYLDASGKLAVLMVEVGASDSKNTEVSGSGLEEGKQFILKVKVE